MSSPTPGPSGAAAPGAAAAVPSPPAETETVRLLRERMGARILGAEENRGQWRVALPREAVPEALRFLQEDPRLAYEFLTDVTAIDHHPDEPRFRVVWVLRSYKLRDCVVLETRVGEDDARVPTASSVFAGANWLERECFDMFGIRFDGHPDLRRILMPDYFEDFPLRKDFPLQGRMADREWADILIARAQRDEGHDL